LRRHCLWCDNTYRLPWLRKDPRYVSAGYLSIGLRPCISANLPFLRSCVFAWGQVGCCDGACLAQAKSTSASGHAYLLVQRTRFDGTKEVRFHELQFSLGFVSEVFLSYGVSFYGIPYIPAYKATLQCSKIDFRIRGPLIRRVQRWTVLEVLSVDFIGRFPRKLSCPAHHIGLSWLSFVWHLSFPKCPLHFRLSASSVEVDKFPFTSALFINANWAISKCCLV
ncbi:hypothetical protein M513_11413, partial [Trichuris suis]